MLAPGAEAAKLTGIDAVLPRDEFAAALERWRPSGRTIYMPHRPEALGAATPGYTRDARAPVAADPWDGRRVARGGVHRPS